MRPLSKLIGLTLVVMAVLTRSVNAATTLHVTADRLSFYSDRFLLEGDGGVRVTVGRGTTIAGDAFSMDLRLNRFLIAGHVRLRSAGGDLSGAAIAYFLDFDRVYFIPVTSLPDRWTYLNGDYAHAAKGREMPGDAFAFPELGNERPNVTGRNVLVGAKQYIRFSKAVGYLGGTGVPLPSYYLYFGLNQNLAQNSLSGSSFDLTYNVAGNANSISALHTRYDSTNRGYLSVEQHLSGAHEYAVFSVNPLTRPDKYWNLILNDRLGSRFELRTFTQLHTQQSWLREPVNASQFTYVYATQAFAHSSLQGLANFTNYNILGPSSYYGPTPSTGALNHPSSFQLTAVSFPNRIGKTPFYAITRYGAGFAHDTYTQGIGSYGGLGTYNGTAYTTIWNHLAGFTLYTPSIKLGNRDNTYKTYVLTTTYDRQRQWFTSQHYDDEINGTASLSRSYSRAFSAYTSFNVVQTNSIYRYGGFGPCIVPPNTPPLCYAGFQGKSTLRTTALGLNYAPNPDFYLGLTARKHDDFPKPVPSLSTLPPLNVLGQQLYNNYLGQPPYDLTGEVRARVASHIVLDVQRSYYFNFGNNRWSPQFIVQVSQ